MSLVEGLIYSSKYTSSLDTDKGISKSSRQTVGRPEY